MTKFAGLGEFCASLRSCVGNSPVAWPASSAQLEWGSMCIHSRNAGSCSQRSAAQVAVCAPESHFVCTCSIADVLFELCESC
jgi:hypothetical protein